MKPEFCSKCSNSYYCKGVCRPCYMKEYRQLPDQVAKRKKHHREHYLQRRNWYLERNKKWRLNNPARDKVIYSRHRYRLKEATPPWLSKEQQNEIDKLYLNCPKNHCIDHIVPLQGKTVCGLHVPWNLRILSNTENCKKHNKLILELALAT